MKKSLCKILFGCLLGATASQAQNWETVSLPRICSFQIPPSLEVQGGLYKDVAEKLQSAIEINSLEGCVIIQPKGLNDFDPVARKTYCRILVETDKGIDGDYAKLDASHHLPPEALQYLDKEIENGLNAAASLQSKNGMSMRILSRECLKNTRIGNVDALVSTYRRSMNGAPSVLVKTYMIPNYDILHRITVSYRESEKHLWGKDLDAVVATFRFVNRAEKTDNKD